ncbi:MAG TPA: type II CAAX endopeptidase family protein [Rhodanobacter sp.]
MDVRLSTIPPPLSDPAREHALRTAAPGLGGTTGVIAGYFALQFVAGMVLAVVIALSIVMTHTDDGLGEAIETTLMQSATQALAAVVSLCTAAVLVLWLVHRRWPVLWSMARPPGFGFTAPRQPWFLLLALVIGLATPMLGSLLTQWLAGGQTVSQDIDRLGNHAPMDMRLSLVLVVVCVGPLVEELLFRGLLLSAMLKHWNTTVAVAASSLVFALVHLPGLQYQWFAVPNLLLLAVLLAALRLRSGSIWPGVVAHASNNLVAVATWFVAIKPMG